MKEKINQLLEEVRQFNAQNADQLEQFRIRFLGRKGLLQDLFDAFKELPGNEKREV
ncbi:MAG: phenylalanine--tRNA ligase subunit alpha, partial [Bacteroidales bacterium]